LLFSSIEFLFAFLPGALLLYFLTPARLKNSALLLLSLLFYAWGGGGLLLLLLLSIASNYALGLLVARARGRAGLRRLCVAGSVLVNLGILGTFKYADFAFGQWTRLAGLVGAPPLEPLGLLLPIGISFYTFQSMSYVFDVARGRSPAFANPVDFALYVAMFPQLIAGPIVRFHEIAQQIRSRRSGLSDFSEGAMRFCWGLVKKIVVADSVAEIADAAFGAPAATLPLWAAWAGVLAYTLQIYFDFSAYSDMAIGLGRMLGFRLPENFERPYSALSITDFWRRWHITLSAWFRDYLYIPLGGSRHGIARTGTNLVVVFLLVGLWHGAAWTFVAWGAYHGVLLIGERVSARRYVEAAPRPALARALTLLLVMLGWVLFRADDLRHAAHYYAALAGLGSSAPQPELLLAATTRNSAILLLASAVFVLPRSLRLGSAIESGRGVWLDASRAALMSAGLAYAGLLLVSGTYNPFLYFRF